MSSDFIFTMFPDPLLFPGGIYFANLDHFLSGQRVFEHKKSRAI